MKILKRIKSKKFDTRKIWSALILLSPGCAFASEDTSTGYLYFLNWIGKQLDGPVAHWFAIIGVAWAGYQIAFGDIQHGGSKALKVGVGLAIAFGAGSLIATIFPSSGAVIGF